eukprot:TRINITY_DN3140_c1_g1_i14.p1 TRINITY_DN3140_c1_g1~~TRINITY_DN3140_c1_g1_i14.p1  ORF type:complete len:871 (+),score=194.78 TRINITY_DN3140_c1_g1_i14:91-2613(+)
MAASNGKSAPSGKRFETQEEQVALPVSLAADAGPAQFSFGARSGAAHESRNRFDAQRESVLLPAAGDGAAQRRQHRSPPRGSRGGGRNAWHSQRHAVELPDSGSRSPQHAHVPPPGQPAVVEKAKVRRVMDSGDWPMPSEAPARGPRREDALLPPPHPAAEHADECREFAARIGADEGSLAALLALGPDLRLRVLERGPLGGAVKDPSAVLLSRIRSVERESAAGTSSGPPVCGDYRKTGSCKRGEQCRYVHIDRSEVEPTRRTRPPGARKKRSDMKHVLCKFWVQGRCSKGADCPFGHEGSGGCAADEEGSAAYDGDEEERWRHHATPGALARPASPPPPPPPQEPPPGPPAAEQGAFLPPPRAQAPWGGTYLPPPPPSGAAPPAGPLYQPAGWPAPHPVAPPVMGPGGWWPPAPYGQPHHHHHHHHHHHQQPYYPGGPPPALPHPGAAGAEDEEEPVTDDEDDRERERRLGLVRQRLVNAVSTLPGEKRDCLTVAFQLVLGEFADEERELLLGMEPNAVGLTRWQSVLMKRTMRHAHESEAIDAVKALSRWEEAMLRWLPPCPRAGYCRHFEAQLCSRIIECVRAMAASPFTRLRLPPCARTDCSREQVSDPVAQCFHFWEPWATELSARDAREDRFDGLTTATQSTQQTPKAGGTRSVGLDGSFALSCGVRWSPSDHGCWPLPFRRRCRALLYAARRGVSRPVGGLRSSPQLWGGILSFVTPVNATDLPMEDRCPGAHDFLDLAAACIANYSLQVLGPQRQGAEDAKQRLGEQMWQYIVDIFGYDHASKMAGMLLQMDAPELLLDVVNTRRFSDALHDAWQVLSEAAADGPGVANSR